ncbi:MAG: response regulator, partial [Oculatellaceae cyanobacterium Prado106]|nr:response regulator [Oculatellaceae cyanobacterium Prado106]
MMLALSGKAVIDKPKILIIDDQLTYIHHLLAVMEHQGFELLVLQDGSKALSLVQQERPDLILLDILMPKVDGFEVCRQLKAHPDTEAIPIIFMSGMSDPVDQAKGLSLGAVDYVTKPLQKEEVIARVNVHLKLRRLTQQLEQHIGALQQAEAALKQSDRQFRAVFEGTFQLSTLMSPQGILLEINEAALTAIGATRSQVIHQPIWQLPCFVHSLSLQEQIKTWVKTAVQEGFVRFEVTFPGVDGVLRTVDATLKTLCDETGAVILLISEGWDITQRKQME